MLPHLKNLLPPAESPNGRAAEEESPLLHTPSLRLEHIVSHGHAGPPGFWYDQPDDEWVLLLRGTATLDFGPDGVLRLKAGDSLTIPARRKHRVADVSDDAVWVALHVAAAARADG